MLGCASVCLRVRQVLDTDSVVLRNLDHLATSAPSPAFVFAWKCYPRRELRASTMVLSPSMSEWERAVSLMGREGTGIYDDLGEQSVWRRMYGSAYELPAGFAAMRTAVRSRKRVSNQPRTSKARCSLTCPAVFVRAPSHRTCRLPSGKRCRWCTTRI